MRALTLDRATAVLPNPLGSLGVLKISRSVITPPILTLSPPIKDVLVGPRQVYHLKHISHPCMAYHRHHSRSADFHRSKKGLVLIRHNSVTLRRAPLW